MNSRTFAQIFLLIFLMGVGFFVFNHKNTNFNNSKDSELINGVNNPSIFASVSSPEIKKDEEKNADLYLVTRVKDGDTILLSNGETVRYIGIDTPESVHPQKPVQCFGKEASLKNEELVLGKMVRLEKDITDRDKYNRLLRYVHVVDPEQSRGMKDLFINYELVKSGYASVYTYPPDVKYNELFLVAQKEARELNKGLWNACQDGQYEYPIVSIESDPNNLDCQIKGNINSSGEKIYHLPNCPYYSKTKIDEQRGERWFCSENEALNAGWRKALNCQ